jgi:hypothetical protein
VGGGTPAEIINCDHALQEIEEDDFEPYTDFQGQQYYSLTGMGCITGHYHGERVKIRDDGTELRKSLSRLGEHDVALLTCDSGRCGRTLTISGPWKYGKGTLEWLQESERGEARRKLTKEIRASLANEGSRGAGHPLLIRDGQFVFTGDQSHYTDGTVKIDGSYVDCQGDQSLFRSAIEVSNGGLLQLPPHLRTLSR